MRKYAVLSNPGYNKVYFKASPKLSVSELAIAAQKMASQPKNIVYMKIAGTDYLTFTADSGLQAPDIEILSSLSFIYALFEIVEFEGSALLRPIERLDRHYIDESISTILKYTGKTNEIFTRLLINAAFYSQSRTRDINLLDPVAGKGTTLYEGLIKGFDVYGVEIGEKAAAEAYHFVKKFLETEKYKHKSDILRISGPGKSFISKKYSFEIAKTKDDLKENRARRLEIIEGNSFNITKFYKKDFFDIIVGDLPYGVRHGNVTNQKQSSLTRNPSELLELCMPAWADVLKPGGAIALSWNVNVLPRISIEQICSRCGLNVKTGAAYDGFEHKVDQSIKRDIIIATKGGL